MDVAAAGPALRSPQPLLGRHTRQSVGSPGLGGWSGAAARLWCCCLTSVTPGMSDRCVSTTMAVSPQSPPMYSLLSLNSASSSCTVDLIWDTCAGHDSGDSDVMFERMRQAAKLRARGKKDTAGVQKRVQLIAASPMTVCCRLCVVGGVVCPVCFGHAVPAAAAGVLCRSIHAIHTLHRLQLTVVKQGNNLPLTLYCVGLLRMMP